MSFERISIIVPIYNVEKYLPRCIESLMGQTYKNIEIILVNDGSTDNCRHICNDYKTIHIKSKAFSHFYNTFLTSVAGFLLFV